MLTGQALHLQPFSGHLYFPSFPPPNLPSFSLFLIAPSLCIFAIISCANFRARLIRFALGPAEATAILGPPPSVSSTPSEKTSEISSKSAESPKTLSVLQKPSLNKPAPEFTTKAVVDGEFVEVKLSQYIGRYVVLFFYPRDFALVCPTEVIAFSEAVDEFKKINTELLGCSTGSVFQHLAWIQQPRKTGGLGGVKMPLLADTDHKICKSYGVLKEEGTAERALFIIDPKGMLRQILVNDSTVGRSVEETMRLVNALQHFEKHGETCPADWKPGMETIKKGAEGKEFFAKKFA